MNRELEYYDIKSGATIEYKKKHRPLRIRLMDESVKTVLIDESMPVSELVDMICKRIGIANGEEYSLIMEQTSSTEDISSRRKGKETLSEEGTVHQC